MIGGIDSSVLLIYIRNIVFIICAIFVIYNDFKYYIIPDYITFTLFPLGIMFSYFTGNPYLISSVLTGLISFLFFFLIAYVYEKKYKEIGLGGGDIKYIASIGAFWGFDGLVIILLLSSFLALICYLGLYFLKKRVQYLPYGVFLALAGCGWAILH